MLLYLKFRYFTSIALNSKPAAFKTHKNFDTETSHFTIQNVLGMCNLVLKIKSSAYLIWRWLVGRHHVKNGNDLLLVLGASSAAPTTASASSTAATAAFTCHILIFHTISPSCAFITMICSIAFLKIVF